MKTCDEYKRCLYDPVYFIEKYIVLSLPNNKYKKIKLKTYEKEYIRKHFSNN